MFHQRVLRGLLDVVFPRETPDRDHPRRGAVRVRAYRDVGFTSPHNKDNITPLFCASGTAVVATASVAAVSTGGARTTGTEKEHLLGTNASGAAVVATAVGPPKKRMSISGRKGSAKGH